MLANYSAQVLAGSHVQLIAAPPPDAAADADEVAAAKGSCADLLAGRDKASRAGSLPAQPDTAIILARLAALRARTPLATLVSIAARVLIVLMPETTLFALRAVCPPLDAYSGAENTACHALATDGATVPANVAATAPAYPPAKVDQVARVNSSDDNTLTANKPRL